MAEDHQYIAFDFTGLTDAEFDAHIADVKAAMVSPDSGPAHHQYATAISNLKDEMIIEGLFDRGAYIALVNKYGPNSPFTDLVEPLTEIVIDPETGEEVVRVKHQKRQHAAAAAARTHVVVGFYAPDP